MKFARVFIFFQEESDEEEEEEGSEENGEGTFNFITSKLTLLFLNCT